jgi:hypothetical protein
MRLKNTHCGARGRLHERLVDPDPAQRHDRHRGRRHDAVEADQVRPEQRDREQPLEEHEQLGPGEERGVDRTAASGEDAQAAARRRALSAARSHEPRC